MITLKNTKTGRLRVALSLLGVGLVACVSLSKPPAVDQCSKENNCTDGIGGFPVGGNVGTGGKTTASGGTTATGGGAAGGTPSTGGSTSPVDTGGIVSTSGGASAGGSASGGTNAGGDETGGSAATGGEKPDAATLGGTTRTGGVAATGGTTRTGGTVPDAAPDSKPVATGGIATGGVAATGGVTSPDAAIRTGGIVSTGGVTSTGGIANYNCASPITPPSGLVTNFSDWNATSGIWTTGSLTGKIFQYASTTATSTVKVEGTPAGLHITGSIPSGNYGGGGISFYQCLTAAAYNTISFQVYGSAPNCTIELQIQTYEQLPVTSTPPGTCKADGGTACYKFPNKSQVVSLTTAVTAPGNTISTSMASMTNWTSAAAPQIVGVQWQFYPSGGTCTPNATFTNIKFTQ